MSLDYRKDGRTVEEFQKDIEDFTEREMYWGFILRCDLTEKGRPCLIEDFGVDNSGNLIEGRLPNYNADKLFKFLDGTEQPIEIKTIPETTKDFFTFKAFSLKSCIKQKAFILVPRSWTYYLISPKGCENICQNYPSKIYPRFSENDPAIRIYLNDIQELIQQRMISKHTWTEKAKNLIKINSSILFRKRYK
jgi:hypothetical protein